MHETHKEICETIHWNFA